MMLRPTIITLLMFCCLTAHATDNDIALQDNHPDRYVVVKGDTLWGIATKFLKDPWQIWKINKAEIKNPHELHPGDVIMFDASDKKPETQAPASAPSTAPNAPTEAKAAETPNNPNTNKQTDRYVVTQGDTLNEHCVKIPQRPLGGLENQSEGDYQPSPDLSWRCHSIRSQQWQAAITRAAPNR